MNISTIGNMMNATERAMGAKTLGKDDFLNLLLKQLSYQDPLNPMDSTEFTVQLAQFSSLEELSNMNSTLSNVLVFQNSMQNAALTNLIGKTVTTSGNTTYLKDTADIGYELMEDASSVTISVRDASGKLVWSKDIGQQAAGKQIYLWDGRDASGNKMPEGTYTFEIEAQDSLGDPVQAVTSAIGTVKSIFFEDSVTYLVLESGRHVNLSEIKSIG